MAKKKNTLVLSICYELLEYKQKKANQMTGCDNATLIMGYNCNNATLIPLRMSILIRRVNIEFFYLASILR